MPKSLEVSGVDKVLRDRCRQVVIHPAYTPPKYVEEYLPSERIDTLPQKRAKYRFSQNRLNRYISKI